MAERKFYAVKKGKVTGIFGTWAECSASVHGYPGAEFKSFPTEAEARAYLGGQEMAGAGSTGDLVREFPAQYADGGRNPVQKADQQEPENVLSDHRTAYVDGSARKSDGRSDHLIAYVDGSYDESLGKYSFGCVLLTPDGEIVEEFGNGSNPDSLAIRNVAGEMLGAMYAVQWGIRRGYRYLTLCYDYQGIEAWATGAWRAKNPLTQKYAAFMQSKRPHIRLTFQKVRAHTGDRYNEQADRLAKRALTEAEGIPEI